MNANLANNDLVIPSIHQLSSINVMKKQAQMQQIVWYLNSC